MKTYRPLACSGLFAFASTTLVLSLYNVHARHVTVPNVVVGMALFYGGIGQMLAGMWEFVTGNTFGATGGYWGNFLNILSSSFGVGGVMPRGRTILVYSVESHIVLLRNASFQ